MSPLCAPRGSPTSFRLLMRFGYSICVYRISIPYSGHVAWYMVEMWRPEDGGLCGAASERGDRPHCDVLDRARRNRWRRPRKRRGPPSSGLHISTKPRGLCRCGGIPSGPAISRLTCKRGDSSQTAFHHLTRRRFRDRSRQPRLQGTTAESGRFNVPSNVPGDGSETRETRLAGSVLFSYEYGRISMGT